MSIEVLAFGQIAEIIGEAKLEFSEVGCVDELVNRLRNIYPQLRSIDYRIAVNKKLAISTAGLKDGDTVALLPPFSGG